MDFLVQEKSARQGLLAFFWTLFQGAKFLGDLALSILAQEKKLEKKKKEQNRQGEVPQKFRPLKKRLERGQHSLASTFLLNQKIHLLDFRTSFWNQTHFPILFEAGVVVDVSLNHPKNYQIKRS